MAEPPDVGQLRKTLVALVKALNASGIDYMVIGGMANIAWGSPRSTADIDVTVALDHDDLPRLLETLGEQIGRLPTDASGFAAETGVLPFLHRSGVRVDLVLGTHPYAQMAIARAVPLRILGTAVKFCTPEDLVLHKIASEREKDRSDVADLLRRRGKTLDRVYLDERIRELAFLLERPEIEERYRALASTT